MWLTKTALSVTALAFALAGMVVLVTEMVRAL